MQGAFSRRGFLGTSMLVGLAGTNVVEASGRARPHAAPNKREETFDLILRPTRVFKTADRSHEGTESWIFSLIVQIGTPAALTPAAMKIDLLKDSTVLRTENYPAEGFSALTYHTSLPPKLADGSASPTPLYWPFVVRLRHTEPVALGVNAMRIAVEAADANGQRSAATITVPIEIYQQKNTLIFPFRGKGIILQAGATNGGHRNRSGAFALDAFGLDDAWSVFAPGEGKKNTDYPGWGRDLIAPADGTIVHARSDRPDQPVADESNPAY